MGELGRYLNLHRLEGSIEVGSRRKHRSRSIREAPACKGTLDKKGHLKPKNHVGTARLPNGKDTSRVDLIASVSVVQIDILCLWWY